MEHGVVGLERLELSTSRLSGVRSNHLSYRPSAWSFSFPAASGSLLPRSCRSHYTPFVKISPSLPGKQKIPAQPDSDQIMLLLVNERVAHCK